MFANFIYFIVALLIYSTYQPSDQTNFSPLDTALFFVSLLLLFFIISKRQFTRIAASTHTSTPDELDRRFSSTLTRQSVIAIALFAVDVYGLNLSSFFSDIWLFQAIPTVEALLFMALFCGYLALVWFNAYDAYRSIYRVELSRKAYVASNIQFSIPVLLPWLLLSGVADLILALPFELPRKVLTSPQGETAYFLLFLFVVAILGPLIIQKFWRCRSLESGYFRQRIDALCRRADVGYADILYWPIFGGRMITAGVMGLVSRFRYILVTDALLGILDPTEVDAVIAHEIGHVTARHSVAQYTRGAFISMAVAGAGIALSTTEYAQTGTMAAGVAGSLLMLSYSRDQERQADELGYEYMVRAGYNPVGQVKTFNIFQELNQSEPGFIAAMMSSHPLTTERVRDAQRRVMAAPASVRKRPLKTASFHKAMASQKKRQPAYDAEAKGDGYMNNKSYQAAAGQYSRASQLYGGDGLFLTKLAIAQYRQKDLRAAKRDSARGARISPKVYFPNFVAGAIHYNAKDYATAQKYLNQADRLLPSQPQNKLFLAASYERLGNRQTAARYYRQVINMAPRSQEAGSAARRLNQMGYRY